MQKPFIVRAGSPETVELTWPKVQRRIAQLIQADSFYTERERDNFDDIDPVAVREALAQRGIVNGQVVDAEANRNSPFVRQVMADVERIAQQQETIADHSQEYRLLDRLRADCEYFLGAGARAEKAPVGGQCPRTDRQAAGSCATPCRKNRNG